VNRNRSQKPSRHTVDIINIAFSVPTVMDPRFFSLRFMACALCTWAINRWRKNLVCNLQYGPQTRLARGIYFLRKLHMLGNILFFSIFFFWCNFKNFQCHDRMITTVFAPINSIRLMSEQQTYNLKPQLDLCSKHGSKGLYFL